MYPKPSVWAAAGLLALSAAAQTPYPNGQPGLPGSDQTHNSQGSLAPGSITVQTDAGGSVETWAVDGSPGDRLMLGTAASGGPPLVLSPTSQVDLAVASLAIVLDGVSFGAGPFDALAFIPPSGRFQMSFSASYPAGPVASYQFAVFGPALPSGFRTTQRIDLVAANACTPGGTPLNLSDDSFFNVTFGGSQFRFYGTQYGNVFVNSNGNLTFTNGDISFSPTVANFLADPEPRIAPLWDDLSPNVAGTVTVRQSGGVWRCCFRNVPHFAANPPDSNNFTVSLTLATGAIAFEYGGCTVGGGTDTLVGISAGASQNAGGVNSDLGGGPVSFPGVRDAIYESFALAAFSPAFDLSFRTINFLPQGGNGVGPYLKP